MSRRILLLLGLIVVSSGIVGSLLLTRGHEWGDDFAAYIMQAQSIVDGRMSEFVKRSVFAVNASSAPFGPVTAPWGFPLVLAPVYAVLGLNVLALKLVLTVFYMAFLVAFFCLARTRLSQVESLLLTAVMAFNVGMLQAQNQILSDLPFLFLSTLGLWLVERLGHRNPDSIGTMGSGAVLGLVIFLAAFTRLNGFLLLLPLAATQWMCLHDNVEEKRKSSRRFLYVAIPYLTCAVCYLGQALMFPNAAGGLREQVASFSVDTLWHNLGYYFWLPGLFFADIISWGKIAYVALLIFFGLGATRTPRMDLPVLLYALATFGLYVTFPLPQGLRYLYPILPIFLMFAFRGMKALAGRLEPRYRTGALTVIYLVWAGLAAASLGTALAEAESNLSLARTVPGGWQAGPLSPASQAMFAFIRQATPADSVVIFFKPRAMRLFTNRDSYIASGCTGLGKGDYVVLVNDNYRNDQIAPDEISQCNATVQIVPVYRQQGFLGYQIVRLP